MRETQMLIDCLGMRPKPIREPALAAPALHGDPGSWVHDPELDGKVPLRKNGEILSRCYQPKRVI